jgi:hypothetical protein
MVTDLVQRGLVVVPDKALRMNLGAFLVGGPSIKPVP